MNEILDVVCGDFVLSVAVLEAVVGGDRLQVVRVSTDDLRPGFRVTLPPDCDVNVRNSQRAHISQGRHFQRLYRPSCPLEEVRGCTSPIEERAVEPSVARLRVLLRENVQQCTSHPHFQPFKRFVDRRVLGKTVPI